jgi:hypothetical protein
VAVREAVAITERDPTRKATTNANGSTQGSIIGISPASRLLYGIVSVPLKVSWA